MNQQLINTTKHYKQIINNQIKTHNEHIVQITQTKDIIIKEHEQTIIELNHTIIYI